MEYALLLIGGVLGYAFRTFQDSESPRIRAANLAMRVAYNEAARLARRIHRQRLEIKRLKAQLPVVVKDPTKYRVKKELVH